MAVNNVTFNGTEYIDSNVLSNAIIGVYGRLEKMTKMISKRYLILFGDIILMIMIK